jgi:NADPH:quinone reductase-like Zn-dependent oxidoreductase
VRAIVLEKFGALDSLVYKDIPDPEPKAGHVVIEVKAFGNHGEMHMRRERSLTPGSSNRQSTRSHRPRHRPQPDRGSTP